METGQTPATRNTTYTQSGSFNLYKFGKVVMGDYSFQAASTAPGGNTLFTIPEGWRPIEFVVFVASAVNSNGFARLSINKDTGILSGNANNNKIVASEWYIGTVMWLLP